MKYTYRFTKDFETALDWVIQNQHHEYTVTFRFTFESYSGVRKGPWMSPVQCLFYMRFLESDFKFKNFTMRLCA